MRHLCKFILLSVFLFFSLFANVNSQDITKVQQKVRIAYIEGKTFHDVVVTMQENVREQEEEFRKMSTYIVVMDNHQMYKLYETILRNKKIETCKDGYIVTDKIILKKDTCIIK